LAEEFYTNTNVTPLAATIQFPANSAAAELLGLDNLKPESSTSWSAGIVAHPIPDLNVTVDAYSISIGNRIASSSTVTASGGGINAPALVNSAIALFGVSLDPTASQQGVTAFLNGMSTLTQGVDATVNYPTDFGDYGLINWTLAGNFNESTIGRINPVPQVLLAANPNATFFNFNSQFSFGHSLPNWRIGLTADWELDQWGATLREVYYGPSHGYASPNSNGEFIPQNAPDVGITDLELRYNITEQLRFAFGANNILNIRPTVVAAAPSCSALPSGVIIPAGGSCRNGPNAAAGTVQLTGTGNVYQTLNTGPYDPNGGYYYGRITFNF
jgi:iron complex outermembrane receptor protein